MASNSEWILGALAVGFLFGILASKDVDSLAVEITPTNSLRALVNFKPALPS